MNRKSALLAASAAILLALAAPLAASAHVSVAPNAAAASTWALIDIKVPNESATATTTQVALDLPTDTPILNVSYVPVAGWNTELVRSTLPTPVEVDGNTITEAVTKVIWTATPGSELAAGQLQVFPLSLGPIPDTGRLIMPAEQTYSDGNVVSWSDTTEGAKHPAPVLYVNDAPAGDHNTDSADPKPEGGHGDSTGPLDSSAAKPASGSTDTIARGLGIAGLVVGAIGVGVAVVAVRRKSA